MIPRLAADLSIRPMNLMISANAQSTLKQYLRLHGCFANIPLGAEVDVDTISISLVFWQIRCETH